MAPKDYVSRAKPKANSRAKKTPNKSPEKAPFPLIPFAVAIILLIGFVAFLYLLKQNSVSETESDQQQQQEEKLPEIPQSKWEFLDGLAEKEVEVELPDEQLSEREPPEYVMQCGSFRTQGKAEEMRAQIAFAGLEAFVQKSEGENGIWYRVVLGPYDKKREAERHRRRIRELNINSCRIW